MSNYQWYLTDTRKKLLDEVTDQSSMKYIDKSDILEQALEMFLKSIKDQNSQDPKFYSNEYVISDYL